MSGKTVTWGFSTYHRFDPDSPPSTPRRIVDDRQVDADQPESSAMAEKRGRLLEEQQNSAPVDPGTHVSATLMAHRVQKTPVVHQMPPPRRVMPPPRKKPFYERLMTGPAALVTGTVVATAVLIPFAGPFAAAVPIAAAVIGGLMFASKKLDWQPKKIQKERALRQNLSKQLLGRAENYTRAGLHDEARALRKAAQRLM